ncbi:MAG TPA: hypothetical protein PKL77_08825 [Candidatus Omnitrophota bacterium]|nr:hypothetical protein [Candidatus Omnitrophota bacterium]HPT07990.1 hypothetical protein [Candidatus Omnitrophota bacterium]
MDQKIKFVLIALGGIIILLIASLFMNFNSKMEVERERDSLKKENTSLVAQVNEFIQSKQQYEDKLNALSSEMDKTRLERDELQKKYDIIDKAREELTAQLKQAKEKSKQSPVVAPQPQFTYTPGTSQAEDAYWANVVKAKTDMEFQLESIRGELKNFQIANEQLQRDKSGLELEVTNLSRERQELKRKIDYNQKIMDSVAQELVREKNDKFQTEDSFKTIKNENQLLRRQLRSLNDRKVVLERRMMELLEKNNGYENRFGEMDTMLRDKMSQIDMLKKQVYATKEGKTSMGGAKDDSVELAPIVVRPSLEAPSAPVAAATSGGRVLAINKENNFIIVDIGEDAGVKVGDVLQVLREGKQTASLEVIQVRKSIAACDVKKGSAAILKVGDIVK